jgi:hypothetical protein
MTRLRVGAMEERQSAADPFNYTVVLGASRPSENQRRNALPGFTVTPA